LDFFATLKKGSFHLTLGFGVIAATPMRTWIVRTSQRVTAPTPIGLFIVAIGKTMKKVTAITCVFVDIGGVLLTDGWNRHARKRAAARFNLDLAEIEDRHHLAWDTHQTGRLTLEEYLGRVVFYKKRPFARADFRRFMFAQSKPHVEMIDLIAQVKRRHGLKIVVVSNEGRELNAYRIRKFKLDGFVDAFISSCFVRVLKPDAEIFRLALDIAHVPASQVVYIENTPMFVQIAEGMGIRSILHTDFELTRARLASFGLQHGDLGVHGVRRGTLAINPIQ
jgi:putative hydrolase of the HAD superfamily